MGLLVGTSTAPLVGVNKLIIGAVCARPVNGGPNKNNKTTVRDTRPGKRKPRSKPTKRSVQIALTIETQQFKTSLNFSGADNENGDPRSVLPQAVTLPVANKCTKKIRQSSALPDSSGLKIQPRK